MAATVTTPVRSLMLRGRAAVVWVDQDRALVAATTPSGATVTDEIHRGSLLEAAYLARIVEAIGDRERVLILGPGYDRLALEREYVAIYRRPDRLIDVEPSDTVGTEQLVDRLHELEA